MKKRSFLLEISLLLILSTACSIPFNLLSKEENIVPDKTIKEEIQHIFEPTKEQTPTFVILPTDQLASADEALFAGEIEKARLEYQEAFTNNSEPELQSRALYGLGRAYLLKKDYYAAIDAFNRILGQYPDTEFAANTYFMVGKAYEEIEEYPQAINAYSRFIDYKPGVIDAFVYKKIGDIAMAIGDFKQAIFNYQAALSADPSSNQQTINLQIGKAYKGLEDYTTAIQYFNNVYQAAQDDYTRSTANLLSGQSYISLGLMNEAYTKFLDSVIKFPKAYDSFTALTILVNDEIPVDEFMRGLVDYYAGSYKYAIQAFQRYLDSNPDNNDGSAYYFLGLSHYFAGNPEKAITAYDKLILNYPGNLYWTAAWDEKAYIQWAVLNEYANASETLTSFVNAAPTSPDAPSFLYEAGRILERSGDLENAANIWQRMMDEYPSDSQSYQALFLAGITYFRLDRYNEARSVFQRALVLATSPDEKAKAYLWIGKCYHALNDDENAALAWKQGELSDPTDYYSIRNSELLKGSPLLSWDEDYDLGYNLKLEKLEAENWLRKTFSIPTEIDLSGLGELENNPKIQEIKCYWILGLYQNAINNAELLRSELKTDVPNTFRLMNFLIDLHLYQPAIYASRNILNMAGMDDLSSLSAPIYFTHIRFGTYFRELIVSTANEYNIPPLLLFALIRQESLFNPYIYSAAGASGLAQIMPTTGQENVDLLKWPPDYDPNDLLRGEVSIKLGAYYLSRMVKYFDGNLQAALAAYNAGPGNTETWLAISDNDPDLFLEVIRAQETQNYLMQIIEFLNIYQLVYIRNQ
ncbi:MAG: tetratricopeptide repeat protein [Anaerolineaceae bacterium]|nr:tetratricopeptide repeat protein [Anaerolineaceae bacterium]